MNFTRIATGLTVNEDSRDSSEGQGLLLLLRNLALVFLVGLLHANPATAVTSNSVNPIATLNPGMSYSRFMPSNAPWKGNVSSPTNGNAWFSGENRQIIWPSSLLGGSQVAIFVLHGDPNGISDANPDFNIINARNWYLLAKESNSGSMLTNPADLHATGNAYKILILSDNGNYLTSKGTFSVNFAGSTDIEPATVSLSVASSGPGTITSTPAGITCGSDCSESYASGTKVTLTVTPSAGATFSGWSGACSGTTATCTVTMDAAKTVKASFTAQNPSDCIFDWAERDFPQYFSPAKASSAYYQNYYYRYYAATGVYLATNDNILWALGPPTRNVLLNLGPMSNFLQAAGCQ